MSALVSASLIAAAGFCFMLANLFMKMMGHMPVYILYPTVAVAFAAGTLCEVEALRDNQLGYAVTFILVCELLSSIVIACLFLNETYSTSNLLGIGLVIAGVALLHLPATKTVEPPRQELATKERER